MQLARLASASPCQEATPACVPFRARGLQLWKHVSGQCARRGLPSFYLLRVSLSTKRRRVLTRKGSGRSSSPDFLGRLIPLTSCRVGLRVCSEIRELYVTTGLSRASICRSAAARVWIPAPPTRVSRVRLNERSFDREGPGRDRPNAFSRASDRRFFGERLAAACDDFVSRQGIRGATAI